MAVRSRSEQPASKQAICMVIQKENLLAHTQRLAYEGREMFCQQAKGAAKLLVFAGHLAY